MICVIQRVHSARVTVDDKTVGECAKGLLLLVCAVKGDTNDIACKMAQKVLNMRIFEDDLGKMNLSITDVGGSCLSVSNFTLAASCRKGKRPDFFAAERPPLAQELYQAFTDALAVSVPTQMGEFGAEMKLDVSLDGPVTIILDSEKDLAH